MNLLCYLSGKIWKPKEQPRVEINDDIQIDTEWDEVLASATEEELVDLAGMSILFGVSVNMLNPHLNCRFT